MEHSESLRARGSEVNDCRRGKRTASLSVNSCGWHVGDEVHDHELQNRFSAGRRADDYVEALASGERCHVLSGLIAQTARNATRLFGRLFLRTPVARRRFESNRHDASEREDARIVVES